MHFLWPRGSTTAIFVIIIFQLGIVAAVVDRPNWDAAEWEKGLEIVRQKHNLVRSPVYGPVKGGADGPIPNLIECAMNTPKKIPGCHDTIRAALVNEILLRTRFKSYNEDCNSTGTKESELVVSPPKWHNGLDYPLYLIWQGRLINSKVQLCDPHEFLRCSAEKKCVCLSGSVLDENVCIYSHGSPCTGYFLNSTTKFGDPSGQDGQLYFNPFLPFRQDSERYVQVITPSCVHTFERCIGDLRRSYHKELSYCLNVAEILENLKLQVFFYFDKLLPLPFNEECNYQEHNRLFTSTKQEDAAYAVRLKTLKDIMTRGTKFCDLQKFLTCGTSEKCECMSPSSRKDNLCVLPDQLDKCEIDPTMEPILMNETLVPRAREKLMKGFANAVTVAACEGKLTCHSAMMEIYCTCPPKATGPGCEETLTRFLPIVRVPSLPTDVVGYPEKVKIFSRFNKVALEFEKIFNLNDNSVCNWKSQNKAEILVGRIRKLMYRGTRMTKGQYECLNKNIQSMNTAHQSQGICRDTLRCQYSTKTCVRQTRRSYLEDLVKELEKSKTRKCNKPRCSKFPKNFDDVDVMFGEDETDFYGGEHEVQYNGVLELAQFCLNIGGLCSLAHNSHHLPNPFILLLSAAMFVVVRNC